MRQALLELLFSHGQRQRRGICIGMAASFLFISTASAMTQQTGPAPDPVLVAETKAAREGRMAEAEKILTVAIHQLEETEPTNPKLADYLLRESLILMDKQDFAGAIAVSRRALEVDKNALGNTDIRVASGMAWIAGLLRRQGEVDEADELLKQALDLVRSNPGKDEVTTDRKVIILSNVWELYISRQKWPEAEALIREGLALCKSMQFPPPTCDSATHTLGRVYEGEGRAAEAEKLPGENRFIPANVAALNYAAQKFEKDEAYTQAEGSYERAISWIEKNPTTQFPELLSLELDSLGQVLEKQDLNERAENAYLRAIEWKEKAAALESTGFITIEYFDFSRLLNFYRKEKRFSDIEPVIHHALEVQEQYLGPRDGHLAQTLVTLADAYQEDEKSDEQKYTEAEALYKRALDIQQEYLGPDHPGLLPTLESYMGLLRKLHEDANAAELQTRIQAIKKRSGGRQSGRTSTP